MERCKIEPNRLEEKAVDFECNLRKIDVTGKTLTDKRNLLKAKLDAELQGDDPTPNDITDKFVVVTELNELTALASEVRAECTAYTAQPTEKDLRRLRSLFAHVYGRLIRLGNLRFIPHRVYSF